LFYSSSPIADLMEDTNKTKKQLIHELTELRSQNTELKKTITGNISAGLAAEDFSRYAESIVETVREPLLVLDADLKIISANRNFYRTFKVIPGETLGYFIYDLGNKQWDIPMLRKLLEEVLPKQEAFDDFEVAHNFQGIGHKIMLLNARQIYREYIGAKIILLAIEDITERKALECLLEESEERYRRLFETASDGIVLLEKGEGKITHANPATEKMLGYTNRESIGHKLRDIGILLDMDDFQRTMQTLNRVGIINYYDVPVENKSGQHIDTDIYLVDRARLVQVNIRDITERKRAQNDLKESLEKYRSLLSHVDSMYLVDRDGTYLFMNEGHQNRSGLPLEEVIGKRYSDFHSAEESRRFLENVGEVCDTCQSSTKEHRSERDGKFYLRTLSPVIGWNAGDKITLVSVISKDITDIKLAEAKLRDALASLRKSLNTTMQVMVSAVETRDPYTAGHQVRSADLARAIAMEMGLGQEKIEGIRLAGSIHDIGKLSIPAEILSKPTKLSEIEFSLIKEHAHKGFEILKDVESPWPLAEIIYQHHERMDGSGYPRQLKGEEILIEAQIISVADVVEAMSSHRPYRPSLGIDAALNEIEKNRGILYDTAVVDACLRLFREKCFTLSGA